MTSIEMVHEIAKLLDSKKAADVTAIQIKDLTTIGDYFVIASGGSNAQVKALADTVDEGLSKLGFQPKRVEGYQAGMWIVMDYYDVMVHIFYEQTREFYSLERLWADAPKVALNLED
ncbi:ribosome silencing factor [Oscillospiraceae bacterium PP1C4]